MSTYDLEDWAISLYFLSGAVSIISISIVGVVCALKCLGVI